MIKERQDQVILCAYTILAGHQNNVQVLQARHGSPALFSKA